MKNDFINKVKSIVGWTGFGVFTFWAICLLAAGNLISAFLTAALAFFISPLRKKIFNKLNISLDLKKMAFISGFLFLSSCGTFIGLTEVEDTSNNTEQQAVEVAEYGTLESAEVELGEILEKENSKDAQIVELEAETQTVEGKATEESSIEGILSQEENTAWDVGTKETVITETNTHDETVISEMQVHFIDVGQGDATLITCDNEAMLIDAGDNSKGTTVQLYLKKQGIKELKYLILTHPDADHIGGADVVVTKFDIENVFMSDFTKDNKTYDELISALNNKSLKWTTPNIGNTYSLGSAEFTIIAPNTSYSDPNNSSIGLVLRNGEDSFLFTGDAEEEAEYDILANGLDINCDVYKAGHHGSKTASTEELLEAATPEYVVISCAEDNSYGHPHAGPMNSFRSMGMKLFRTDEQGSVIAMSNGVEITWNCAPSESWKAGEGTQSSNSSKEPPVVVEPPVVDPNSGILVWKSATGEKYHSINNCGRMNPNKATQMTKTEAEALGLGPCSKCW